MNPIVEKVYQIGIIPVIAFGSVDDIADREAVFTAKIEIGAFAAP